MLICNEGPPRAGKSYDAVRTHILPALKAGRKVYARLNGLDFAKIAAYLQVPESRIRDRLVVVSPDEVIPLFTAFDDDPPKFNVEPDALIVIDEVHEFYVSGRQPLPKEQEAFFAKHGHIGLDIVVMTQALGRLHSSIRQRIERKSLFTKLNALGSEDRYAVRFYSVGDTMGKFEKISSETHSYDAAIFDLYQGFQPGTTNTGAYTAGSKTVWQVIKKPAIAVACVVVVGIVGIGWFFKGDGMVKEPATAAKPATPPPSVTPSMVVNPMAMPVRSTAHSPEVALVLEYGKAGRPRYAGSINDLHVVEWRTTGGQVLDRLTSEQLIELGWTIQRTEFGVVARADDELVIFTAWPLDEVFTQSEQTAQRIRTAGEPRPPTEEAAVVTSGTQPRTTGAIIGALTIHAPDRVATAAF